MKQMKVGELSGVYGPRCLSGAYEFYIDGFRFERSAASNQMVPCKIAFHIPKSRDNMRGDPYQLLLVFGESPTRIFSGFIDQRIFDQNGNEFYVYEGDVEAVQATCSIRCCYSYDIKFEIG